jgi:hypothetical protein
MNEPHWLRLALWQFYRTSSPLIHVRSHPHPALVGQNWVRVQKFLYIHVRSPNHHPALVFSFLPAAPGLCPVSRHFLSWCPPTRSSQFCIS